MAALTTSDTKQTILAVARILVQAHGYNALSFRNLAKEVGVKSASIHYHFPTKGDLGAALARRYADDMEAHLDGLLAASQDQAFCLKGYTEIFRRTLLNNNRMCLYGIMAAEHEDLPEAVRIEVDRFTEVNVQWLAKVLSLRKAGTDKRMIQKQALAILAAIEGAQLVARGRGNVSAYDEAVEAYRLAGLLP